jgi:DNA-binding NtrC family response regulator
MVEEGSFRADLFYRLDTLTLEVPPLRERRDEIEPLAARFLQEARTRWNVAAAEFEPDVLRAFHRYDWPGNVRQLRNVVERAALLCRDDVILLGHLPAAVTELAKTVASAASKEPLMSLDIRQRLRDFEARALAEALERTGGNRSAAARLLRMPTASFFRRLKTFGMDR